MWRDLERYTRGGDTRGEERNEARLRTGAREEENHEEREKWDTS